MSEQSYLLAIDNGTQSVRALLFDLAGNLVGKGKVELEAYYSSQPGWAEQDPEYYWAKLGEACQLLWAQSGIDRRLIRGVSLTTQRGTVIHVDGQGKPLRPAILWLDQRRAEVEGRIKGPWGWLFKLAGAEGAVDYFRSQAEVNWVAQQQPELHAATHKVLLLSGFLTHRLCGRFVDSLACSVAYLPFDYKRLKWAAPRDWKWQAVKVRQEQLPELFKPGAKLGAISAEASRHTGIPEGLPLIAAGADKACEVLGAGAIEPSVACLSYGTTATINTTRARYLETIPLIPPYPAAIPDHFNTEVMIYRGFWMVSWFKREFGLREMQRAAELGVEPEKLFDELVEQVPPGSMGLMLQPYWTPGIREPGLEAKGAVIGFGDVHTRAHLYRAILEGLAYALRQGKERIEKRSGTRIERLRVAGGGSQSDAAMQLSADIFGLPAERPHVYEASGLGAAIDCAVGLGLYPDFAAAIAAMTRVGEVFQPQSIGDIGGSFKRSLWLGLIVMLLTVSFSFLAGLAFRRRFAGSAALFYVAVASLIMPSVVVSLGIGALFELLGIERNWWSSGLGAHLTWTLPFGLLIMFAVFNRFDKRFEEAARDLGAGSWATFRLVTLPMIFPGVMAGALLAFALSIDDFVITYFNSGQYTTFPLWIWGVTRVGIPPQVNVMGTLIFAVGVLIAVANGVLARRRNKQQ